MDNKKTYNFLLSDLTKLRGVGNKTANLLKKKRIETIFDLLWKLPKSFTDRSVSTPIDNLKISMDNFIRKRIDIATCWATNRISAMDTLERYEDSYAIAEEFREWILHIGEKNENLKDSVLNFPKELKKLLDQKVND